MRQRPCLAAVTVCLLALPATLLGQAEVTALSSDSDPLESTDQLRLSRFADFSEETMVAVGTLLEIGDLLSGISAFVDVELACGDATVLRFSGGFRLLIEEPNLSLGVEGTELSLTLSRDEEGPDRDLSVFEGQVRVRGDSLDQRVETGRSWRYAGGEQMWGLRVRRLSQPQQPRQAEGARSRRGADRPRAQTLAR